MRTLQEQGIILSSPQTPQPNVQNPQPTTEMRESTTDSAVAYAIALLSHYGFELRGYTAAELVSLWLRKYSAHWVRLGIIEALYQGRYKAVSVEQILAVWARRGQPIYRFNHEFERLISRKLPQNLMAPVDAASTELGRQPNLPPLKKKDNITDVNTTLEAGGQSPTPITQQETPPTASMPKEELTEISVNSDEPRPELPAKAAASSSHTVDWSHSELNKQPIHQFTPSPDSSDFYLKLKAVVQQQEEIPPKVVSSIDDEDEAESPQSQED